MGYPTNMRSNMYDPLSNGRAAREVRRQQAHAVASSPSPDAQSGPWNKRNICCHPNLECHCARSKAKRPDRGGE